MLHAGTVVAAGTGLGVAVATGSETQVGRISALIDAVDPLQTPLTRELDRLGTTVTAVIGVAAVHARGRGRGARLPARRRRPGGHQPRRRRRPGGAPGRGHDRAGDRRAQDGAPAGDHPPPARRRDPRLDHGRRVGQDRHADPQPDDGAGGVDAGCRRRAARAAARERAVQRRLARAWRRRGASATRRRPRCSSTPRHGDRRRCGAGGEPAPRRPAVRFRAQADGHAARGARRRDRRLRQGRARGGAAAVRGRCRVRRGGAGRAARGPGSARARARRRERRTRRRSRTPSAACASWVWRP